MTAIGGGTNAVGDFDYLAVEYMRPPENAVTRMTMTGGAAQGYTNRDNSYYVFNGAATSGTNTI